MSCKRGVDLPITIHYLSFQFSTIEYCFSGHVLAIWENQVLRFCNSKLLKGERLLVEQRRVELLASALRTRRSAN